MPISIWTGRAGAFKTSQLCQRLLAVLKRNKKFFKKTGIIRKVYLNFPVVNSVLEDYKDFLDSWETLEDLIKLENCDIFIDELINFFDAQGWKNLSPDVKKFLAIHRHLGLEIYATSQDFGQVDISFRRLTDTVYYTSKLFGNRDPSPTTPPIKFIYGLGIIYTINPVDYKEDQKENTTKFHWIYWQTRAKTEIYDTLQRFKPVPLSPFKHQVRYCEDPACEIIGRHGKIIHA